MFSGLGERAPQRPRFCFILQKYGVSEQLNSTQSNHEMSLDLGRAGGDHPHTRTSIIPQRHT